MNIKVKDDNKIAKIKKLYGKVIDKPDFQEKAAIKFGLKISSIRTNWFNRFEITEKYSVRSKLIEFMNDYIKNQ